MKYGLISKRIVKSELRKLLNKAEILSRADGENIKNSTWKEVKEMCGTLLLMVDRLEKKNDSRT